MKFFQKDPMASLAATRAMLTREEATIASLNETRAQRLAEEADPGPVAEIDEQIERHDETPMCCATRFRKSRPRSAVRWRPGRSRTGSAADQGHRRQTQGARREGGRT